MNILFKPTIKLILKLMPLSRFHKFNSVLYKLMGVNVGLNTKIYSSVEIQGLVQLSIGENTFIGDKTVFTGGNSKIVIGSNCDISDQVAFVTGTHEFDAYNPRTAGKCFSKNI